MKKIYATYLLFLFIAFLAAPTVVKLIDENANVSIVYNFAEEEQSETSVSSIIDFVLDSQSFDAFISYENHSDINTYFYQFVIKSHHKSIPSPPPDYRA